MANKTSQHILSTSANLLGFCLFIITALHLSDANKTSLIDEFTSIIAILLIISSVFSFISIRTANNRKEELLEKIADYFFLGSLFGIFVVIIFILVNLTFN